MKIFGFQWDNNNFEETRLNNIRIEYQIKRTDRNKIAKKSFLEGKLRMLQGLGRRIHIPYCRYIRLQSRCFEDFVIIVKSEYEKFYNFCRSNFAHPH